MIIGKRIIDAHILEEPSNVVLEKAFDLRKVEIGVNEDSPNVGLDNVREALDCISLDALRKLHDLPLGDSLSWSSSP